MSTGIRPIGEHDVDALQELLGSCTAFAVQVTGYPTGSADAISMLLQLPEGLPEDRKSVLGLWDVDGLLGCADLLIGHPAQDVSTLGLLLVQPDRRRRGIGRRLHDAVLDRAAEAATARMRLAVIDVNAADSTPFWRALGYRAEGDAVPYRYDKLESVARHWSRPVRRPQSTVSS